jgi:hypothetical protein
VAEAVAVHIQVIALLEREVMEAAQLVVIVQMPQLQLQPIVAEAVVAEVTFQIQEGKEMVVLAGQVLLRSLM